MTVPLPANPLTSPPGRDTPEPAARTAEFAVWVEDAWQGCGVGSLLTRAILRLLVRHGVSTAIGIMEPGNLAVRRLVNRIAPHATTRSEDGMIVVSIPLENLAADPDARS